MAGFVVHQLHVVKSAPVLHLSEGMSKDEAITWLEARNWQVSRVDIG
jgi:hypothetical protein